MKTQEFWILLESFRFDELEPSSARVGLETLSSRPNPKPFYFDRFALESTCCLIRLRFSAGPTNTIAKYMALLT